MKSKFQLSDQILATQDYRVFLKRLVESRSKTEKVNFSELTRRAGFTSRSYIKEVIDGKKSLSVNSVERIKVAFRLQGKLGSYFETLVALNEEDVNIENLSEAKLLCRLERQRERLKGELRARSRPQNKKPGHELFLNKNIGEVYASLGTYETGASIEEIERRSKLPRVKIQGVLEYLLRLKAIETREQRYFAVETELDIFNLGDDLYFKSVFLESLKALMERVEKKVNSEDDLFMYSVVSVSKERFPELKERLKKVILQFLDEEQSDAGDSIAKLTLGFYS